ncbi:hypothetical protein [Nocardia tengchongensis]|uniref:hypothetical protein n=1 Tax=Nocardia tengchongensis TaxID=2055889 RepID=UPI0036C8786F
MIGSAPTFDLLEYDHATSTHESIGQQLPWMAAAHAMRDRMDIVRELLDDTRLKVWPARPDGFMCAQIGGTGTAPEFEWFIRPAR